MHTHWLHSELSVTALPLSSTVYRYRKSMDGYFLLPRALNHPSTGVHSLRTVVLTITK